MRNPLSILLSAFCEARLDEERALIIWQGIERLLVENAWSQEVLPW